MACRCMQRSAQVAWNPAAQRLWAESTGLYAQPEVERVAERWPRWDAHVCWCDAGGEGQGTNRC